MMQGAGTGKEMDAPKNLSELASLTGMPAVHAGRTVRHHLI